MNYMRVKPLLCDGFLNGDLEYDSYAGTRRELVGYRISSHVFFNKIIRPI
jgi:hypothetical protein